MYSSYGAIEAAKTRFLKRKYPKLTKSSRLSIAKNGVIVELGTFDKNNARVLYLSGVVKAVPRQGTTPKERQACINKLRGLSVTLMQRFAETFPHIEARHIFTIDVDDTIMIGKPGSVTYELMLRPTSQKVFLANISLLTFLSNRINLWIQSIIKRCGLDIKA